MSRLYLCFLVAIVPSMLAHVIFSPRQDVSAAAVILSTTTSSINWWPYPAGGVTTSTSVPIPTLVLLTPTSPPSPSSTPIISSSSTPKPTISSHSVAVSLIHSTTSAFPVPSPSSDSQSFLRPDSNTHTSIWLVPLCLLSGAVIGFIVGWLAWRHFGKKRDNMGVDNIPDRYSWAYKDETECKHDKDMEHGYGKEYLSSGNGTVYHLEQGNRRMPSTASTSGARTWVDHPQTRKRSGFTRASTGSDRERENTNDARSPLLTQTSPSDVLQDSKPLPASPLPSPSSYGNDEGDDVQYENIRHKSVRQRIWERLCFAEGDLGRKNSNLHEGEGKHTWSAGAKQECEGVGRSLSLWGRRKTVKEGRVERWVRGVMGSEEGDIHPEAANRHEVPPDSMSLVCGEISPHLGTPELVLSTLRRVSPSVWHSQDSNDDLATALGFSEKSPELYPSTSRHLNATMVAHPATTRSGQRRSLRRLEQRSRGVSLQDPGPVSRSESVPRRTAIRTSLASKNAIPLRSITTSRSNHSPITISSPTPPTPSSVSRYSVTPHVPALSTLNRSLTRTPTRVKVTGDLRTTLTRAAPFYMTRPVSTTTPPRDSHIPPRTRPSPGGIHTKPQSQQRIASELPSGPSSLLSPPLQSALCFDDTLLLPLTGRHGAPMASKTKQKHPTSSRAQQHSTKPLSASGSTGSTLPNARTSAIPSHSRYGPTEHTPVPVAPPRPFSPKERYLARQNANARVGMILSRSYSSSKFDGRPLSPTMFGAVINEELENEHSEVNHGGTRRDTLAFLAEGGEGIEQRLDRLRKL